MDGDHRDRQVYIPADVGDERTALIAERAGLLDLVARLQREVKRLRDEIAVEKIGGRCPGRQRKVEVEVQEEAMA